MEISYKRKEKKKRFFTVKNGEERLHASFYRREGIIEMNIDWYPLVYEKKDMDVLSLLDEVFKEGEKIAYEWKIGTIFYNPNHFPKKSERLEEIKIYFAQKCPVSESISDEATEEFLCRRDISENDCLYPVFLDNTQKVLHFAKTFEHIIQERIKEDPTISILQQDGYAGTLYYTLYIEGTRISIHLRNMWEDKELRVDLDGEVWKTYPLENYTKEEWKRDWEEKIEKIYEKNRLKTLFQPPTFHQDKNILLLTKTADSGKQIMDHLRSLYNPKELEILFAFSARNRKIESQKAVILPNRRVTLSRIDTHLFVFMEMITKYRKKEYDDHMFIYSIEEKEKAIEKYMELLQSEYEEKEKEEKTTLEKLFS